MGLWMFSINSIFLITMWLIRWHNIRKCSWQLTHSSKVRCLVNNSGALFFLDIVIHHNLESSFIPTLNEDKDNQIKELKKPQRYKWETAKYIKLVVRWLKLQKNSIRGLFFVFLDVVMEFCLFQENVWHKLCLLNNSFGLKGPNIPSYAAAFHSESVLQWTTVLILFKY